MCKQPNSVLGRSACMTVCMAYIFIYGVYHGFIKVARLISIKDYLVFVFSYMAAGAGNRTNYFTFLTTSILTVIMVVL
jgi:hypothetical protein